MRVEYLYFYVHLSVYLVPGTDAVTVASGGDETPAVRVNCKTPGLMLFQIYEPKVRTLLKAPSAKRLLLFSEDAKNKQPVADCLQNYTISDSPGWSTTFSFLTYGTNSSCLVKSYLIDKEETPQQTYVADVFIKVLSAEDRIGEGKRGKIRLSCTMLAAQQVTSGRADLRTEVVTPSTQQPPLSAGDGRNPTGHTELPLDLLTAQLESSLMLRFFKLFPGSNFPVPAVSVTEGEDIYLVAALRSGGPFAVLRPVNCTIRSIVSSTPKDGAIRELVHSQSGSENTIIRDFSVLDNGCQSTQQPWEMDAEAASNNIFRLYYTKFLAPTFSGSLKLSAKCSINLCTQQNSKACIEQPKPMLAEGCFTMAENVPNFQFHSETITNISELQPANIFMVTPTFSTRSTNMMAAVPSLRLGIPNAGRNTQTKEDKGIFKRNITTDPPALANFTNEKTTTKKLDDYHLTTDHYHLTTDSVNGETLDRIGLSTSTPYSTDAPQEVKYCFLQRTVTMASVSVVVVLILSIILVSFSIMTHCRHHKRHDRTAILDDLR